MPPKKSSVTGSPACGITKKVFSSASYTSPTKKERKDREPLFVPRANMYQSDTYGPIGTPSGNCDLAIRVPYKENGYAASLFNGLTLKGDFGKHQTTITQSWLKKPITDDGRHWTVKIHSDRHVCVCRFALALACAYRVPYAQYAKYATAFKSIPGCEDIPIPDFIFPPKALDKLRIDIVPTPDPNMHVIIGASIFPLLTLLENFIGLKAEKVGGSIFDGYPLPTANVKEAVAIMEDWGWKPTVYDEVN